MGQKLKRKETPRKNRKHTRPQGGKWPRGVRAGIPIFLLFFLLFYLYFRKTQDLCSNLTRVSTRD